MAKNNRTSPCPRRRCNGRATSSPQKPKLGDRAVQQQPSNCSKQERGVSEHTGLVEEHRAAEGALQLDRVGAGRGLPVGQPPEEGGAAKAELEKLERRLRVEGHLRESAALRRRLLRAQRTHRSQVLPDRAARTCLAGS